jgi:hypothetical protein
VTANTQYTTNVDTLGHSPVGNVSCPHCKLSFKTSNKYSQLQNEAIMKRQRDILREMEAMRAEMARVGEGAEEDSMGSMDSRHSGVNLGN